jgi:hypothetical protein
VYVTFAPVRSQYRSRIRQFTNDVIDEDLAVVHSTAVYGQLAASGLLSDVRT